VSAGVIAIQRSLMLGKRNFGGITPAIVYGTLSRRIDWPMTVSDAP
jgi:hypothetical protein